MSKKHKPRLSREPDRLYLAYGSNLNLSLMKHRAPDAIPIGRSAIRDMRLVFRAVADIIPAPGFKVPVGVWRISEADEAILDQVEGVKTKLYRRIKVRIDGEKALSYRMFDRGLMAPSEHYLKTIRDGYKVFDLDQKHLKMALDYTIKNYSPTDQTWARWRARTDRENRERMAAFMESLKGDGSPISEAGE